MLQWKPLGREIVAMLASATLLLLPTTVGAADGVPYPGSAPGTPGSDQDADASVPQPGTPEFEAYIDQRLRQAYEATGAPVSRPGTPGYESARQWLASMIARQPRPGTPEYSRAVQLAHRERTLALLRNLGAALFRRLDDTASLPQTAPLASPSYSPLAPGLLQLLVPAYTSAEEVSELDGWGHPIEILIAFEPLRSTRVLCLRSPGRDGTFSADTYALGTFDPEDFDQDLVWCDGFFVRLPERRSG